MSKFGDWLKERALATTTFVCDKAPPIIDQVNDGSFSLLTPLLWVAAMFLLLLAVRSVLRSRSSRKEQHRETIEWGRSRPSLILRWRIKMRRMRFRQPRFSQRYGVMQAIVQALVCERKARGALDAQDGQVSTFRPVCSDLAYIVDSRPHNYLEVRVTEIAPG
jgi:hypothetical protein